MNAAIEYPWKLLTYGFNLIAKNRRNTDKHYQRILANCGSPIEKKFLEVAWLKLKKYGYIDGQTEIRKYRADFTITTRKHGLMFAIELDGHDFHKSKDQRNHDSKRQNDFLEDGYLTIRFTGSQVYQDVHECVARVERIIKRWHRRETIKNLKPKKKNA